MSGTENSQSIILDLPPDLLFLIFSYCDVQTLGNLSRVCKEFNYIISQDCLWIRRSKKALVTNQLYNGIKNRSYSLLSAKEKCRISNNWRNARYSENHLVVDLTRYMPWLQLSPHRLWYSRGNTILCCARLSSGHISHKPLYTLHGQRDDIRRFVRRDGLVVSAGRDGYINGWLEDTGQKVFEKQLTHPDGSKADAVSVDYCGQTIVTGVKDKSVQVWNLLNLKGEGLVVNVCDRVWSVAISPEGRTFSCGTAGLWSISPLQLYDINTGACLRTFDWTHKLGAGVLDICYENPWTLLSCGYDTYIRMWDVRSRNSVLTWEDPHDSSVYCLASDDCYTVVSGTGRNGLVRLWDKRKNNCVQMYYTGCGKSPVYSVTFDPCHMYVALDRTINLLDFSGFHQRVSYW